MNTSEVLNKAADLIERQGWGRGSSSFNWQMATNVPVCAEGAILMATGGRDELGYVMASGEINRCSAGVAVRDYLNLQDQIWAWNDAADRTASEVIEVLRAAALIEAAREDQDAAWETYAGLVTA